MELDIRLAETSSNELDGGKQFRNHISLLRQRSLLEVELQTHQASANVIAQILTYTALVRGNGNLSKSVAKEAAGAKAKVKTVVNRYDDNKQQCPFIIIIVRRTGLSGERSRA